MFTKTTPPAAPDSLAAARRHLEQIRQNAAAIGDVERLARTAESELLNLRRQRGADPSPNINREIGKRSDELDGLGDRLQFLRNEGANLQRAAGEFIGALDRELNNAVQRAQAEYRERFIAAVQALLPIVVEGLQLGAAGCLQIGAACKGITIPDPRRGAHSPLAGIFGLVYDGIFAPELSAPTVPESANHIVADILAHRSAANELRTIITRAEADARAAVEENDRLRRAAGSQFSSARLGGMPGPEDPERVKGNKLFPRMEYAPTTVFPNDPARRETVGSHMHPESATDNPALTRDVGA